MPSQYMIARSQKIMLIFACLALAAVFSGYMLTGSYMRLSGDDYCYDAVERQQGFWQMQRYSYLHPSGFGSNGYSLTFVSAISSQVGIISSRILPGMILILWFIGEYLLLIEISRLFSPEHTGERKYQALKTLLISGAIIFFTLYLAPNLGQSFYWRSGLLTYLMPMIFISYLTAFFTHTIRSQHQVWWTWLILFVLSFVGAGFSEAFSPMQLGLYGLVLVTGSAGALAGVLTRRLHYASVLKPTSAVLIGTLLALLIMILSPVNHIRQQGLPPPPGFTGLIGMAFENTFVFYKIALIKQLLPLVLIGLVTLAIAYLVYSRQAEQSQQGSKPFAISRVIKVFAGLIIAGYLLIACIMAPVAYGISSYPDARTLIVPDWIMVTQIASLGWLAGWTLSHYLISHHRAVPVTKGVSMVIILGVSIFTFVAARNVYAKLPQYQRWATYWDMRNAQIIQSKNEGQTVVHVMEIDHIIPGVDELRADPFYWYNRCAARYYGIERIYADLPGWDK